MHFTYLFPHMDEASKLLEDITISHQWLPTGYHKLSLEPPLVDQVVDSVSSMVDPTLPSKSEFQVVYPDSSVVDPTLPLKSEVKVVELMISPPNITLSSESVETEVVTLTQYSSQLPVESKMKPYKVFIVSLNCSMQGKIMSVSIEPVEHPICR